MSAHLLAIEGEMTIYRAAELKASLLEALERHAVVEVDLSQVSELDTAGLQLLMMAKQASLRGERVLRLVSHSPAVLEAFELVNVAAYFGDPLVISDPLRQAR